MNAVWPLLTAALAAVFSGLLVRQYLVRRKTHQWVWALGFGIFAFAAFCEFYSELVGWNPALYRFYYVSAAALVGYLGAGTVFLIFSRRAGWILFSYVTVLTLAMLVRAWQLDVIATAFVPGKVVAGQAMPEQVRLFSPLLTIPGSLALLGGALYSWVRGRAAYNLFIAAGTIIIAGAGGLARFGWPGALYLGEMLGLASLFYGFVGSWRHLRPLPAQVPPVQE